MTLPNLSGLRWIPGFEYTDCDVPVSIELSVPQAPWAYIMDAKGGWAEVDSGEQESFVTRHNRAIDLHLRMTETEWIEKIEPMMKVLWAQAQEFGIYLDVSNYLTLYSVRLVSPVPGEEMSPTPSQTWGLLELRLRIRTSDGTPFADPYHSLL